MNSIIIFGDENFCSLNNSWIENFKKHFSKQWMIYDISIKNELANALEKRILQEAILRKEKERNIIIICTGFNDAKIDLETGKTKTEPAEFKQTIKNILNKAKQVTSDILVVGIPSIDNNTFEKETIEEFDNILRAVCDETGTVFADTARIIIKELLKEDGLGLSEKGSEILANLIFSVLSEHVF